MPAAHGKQFSLYVHLGPNPWKVAIILHELGFGDAFECIPVNAKEGDHKKAPYTNLNPNGRMPTLIDHHNNDFVIWESGAIIYYLIEKYDTQHKISFENFEERALAMQYLIFQVSGQGPYFGQAAWFAMFHSEKLPSAIERYVNEIFRVNGVLEDILKDKDYLVGGKLSYADLSFIVWNSIMDRFSEGTLKELSGWREKYPNVAKWDKLMNERESVKAVNALKAVVYA